MLGALPRRLIESVVGLFALLGFFYVPLGKLTGFEHLKAIANTQAAERAGDEVLQAMQRIRVKLFGALTGMRSDADDTDSGKNRPLNPIPSGASPRPPRLHTK